MYLDAALELQLFSSDNSAIFIEQEKNNYTVKLEFISSKRKEEKQGILKAPPRPYNRWVRVRVSETWLSSYLHQLLHSGNLWFWSADPHTSEQLSWPACSQEISDYRKADMAERLSKSRIPNPF